MTPRPTGPIIAPGAADEADVVLFAGGGGSSIAIREALGKEPDASLNHWPLACSVHLVNFPDSETHCADVMETDCRIVVPGRPIRLLWLSPDCRHFSPAKGSAPVSDSIRALAWAAIPWARLRRPRVIMLENVEAFLTWGPTLVREDGKTVPDPARKGETFARWKSRLEQLGYVVEWKILSAADYGAPTIRKRLFLVARCDGRPIVWPEPTHAPRTVAKAKGLKAHRAAAEIIDWTKPCPSIFLAPDEARALRVKRPLEEATLRRIAKGLFRYTIQAADPFIVPVTHAGDERAHSAAEPLRTITSAHRGEFAVVAPVLTGCGGRMGDTEPRDPRDPYATVTSKNDSALAAAFLTKFSENSSGHLPDEPLHTVMAGAPRHGLVAAQLVGLAHGEHSERAGLRAHSPDDPLRTIHAQGGNHALLSAHLVPRYGERDGQEPRCLDVEDPLPTIVGTDNGGQLVAAYMEQANTDMVGHDARSPVSTIVGKGCTQRLISAQLSQFRHQDRGADARAPLNTITAQANHQAVLEAVLEVDQPMVRPYPHEPGLRAFLVKYYGAATAQDLADPLGTVTSRARFGLVVVKGVAYRIVDIGMRMLDPETELAAAMGVPKSYVLGFDASGRKVTKTAVTKMVGNMVSPPPAIALLRANFPEIAQPERAAA